MKKILPILLMLSFPFILFAQNLEGNIMLISGKEYKTKIKGAKEWTTNTSDTTLKSGLRIKTDENTSLRVILKDRFVIFIPGDSDINFTKLSDSEELITILKGNILISTDANNKVKGAINTPTAEIIRERPAELIVNVNALDGTTEIIVLQEEVMVKNLIQSDNNYKTIKKEMFSKVLPQVLPTEPSPIRLVDIDDLIKKIKVPLYSMQMPIAERNPFDSFIEEFQFDTFFTTVSNNKSCCKDTYTSPDVPVDFEKNLLSRDSVLILNVK